MGENIRSWSTTAASNATADSSINWAEGQAASSVNDSARSMMSTIAKWRSDFQGSLLTTGSSNTFAVTSATGYTALADGLLLLVKFNAGNTSAATLNVDSLGAKALRKWTSSGEAALASGDIQTGYPYEIVYSAAANAAAGGWIVTNLPGGSGFVSTARQITGTGYLTGGGDLSADRTIGLGSLGGAGRLLGSPSTGSAIGDITLGTGLSMSSGVLNCTVSGGVASSRAVNTSGYITGGGDLSADRTHTLGSMGAVSRLLGSGSAAATIGDITLGPGLVMSSTTLSVTSVTGNAGKVFTTDGSAASWGSGVNVGTAAATTSGTSIDFTSIPSWVKRITVALSGVSSNGTSLLQFQIGAGSVVTTGYAGFGGIAGSSAAGTAAPTSGFPIDQTGAAAYVRYGIAILTNIGSNTWVYSFAGGLNNSGAGFAVTMGGVLALGGALDRVRLTTVNGTDTFDAGSINITWE